MFFILFNLFHKFSIPSNPLVSLESSSRAYVSDNVFILPFCLLILYVENFKFVWFSLIKSEPLNTESCRWIVWCWLKVFILDFSLFLLFRFLFIPDLLTFGDNVCKVTCILFIMLGSSCTFSIWILGPSTLEKFHHDFFDTFPHHLFVFSSDVDVPALIFLGFFLIATTSLSSGSTSERFLKSNLPSFLLNYSLFWQICLYYLEGIF